VSTEHSRFRQSIRVSDIVAGFVGTLVVLPELIDQRNGFDQRVAVVVALFVGLAVSWFVTRERHWIVKAVVYACICLLCALLAQFAVRTF
jgi:hypothetical protein